MKSATPQSFSGNEFKKRKASSINYVVIGGGIAGVSCAKEIARLKSKDEDSQIILITSTELLKESAGVMKITNHLEEVSVFERTADRFQMNNPLIDILCGEVRSIDTINRIIYLSNQEKPVHYERLCVCSGAQPKMIAVHPNIISIRDLQSVADMAKRLSSARKIVVVGNGGIALELVHSLTFCDIEWVLKDNFLGSAFFDASASAFVMPSLLSRVHPHTEKSSEMDVVHPTTDSSYGLGTSSISPSTATAAAGAGGVSKHQGAALGPEWLAKSKMMDAILDTRKGLQGSLVMNYEQSVVATRDGPAGPWVGLNGIHLHLDLHPDLHSTIAETQSQREDTATSYPLYVLTSEDKIIGCDFLVSATGVTPCVDYLGSEFLRVTSPYPSPLPSEVIFADRDADSSAETVHTVKHGFSEEVVERYGGALVINNIMQTSVQGVYAAGDCCHYNAHLSLSPTSSFSSSDPEGDLTSSSYNDATAGPHWFQMRLWTQARSMGTYAAQCMCGKNEDLGGDMFFELFAHVTRFFGHKVVLLGRYNAQGLGAKEENVARTAVFSRNGLQIKNHSYVLVSHQNAGEGGGKGDRTHMDESEPSDNNTNTYTNINTNSSTCDLEIWTRSSPGVEYVKVVVFRGKVVGALLVGDTGLEEVFENLILNQLDVSHLGVDMLDPAIDLEDFFD